VLSDVAQRFQREQPNVSVSLQPSGSLVAARKIAELGMRADMVAVADVDIIDQMLVPRFATWNLEFLTNEIVIAHRDHSLFTDQITTENWSTLMLRPKVRLGCTNPDTAPLGYRTLFVWQLVGRGAGHPDLVDRLRARCADEHVVPDEEELVKLLEARAIDYAFIYRSTAESHHLKFTVLPKETNLAQPNLADHYAKAAVKIHLAGETKVLIRGRPVVYGLTIPINARNPKGALKFAIFLLNDWGRRALARAGFHTRNPAPCRRFNDLPAVLRPFSTAVP